jgi:hypothetical protein
MRYFSSEVRPMAKVPWILAAFSILVGLAGSLSAGNLHSTTLLPFSIRLTLEFFGLFLIASRENRRRLRIPSFVHTRLAGEPL